MPLGILTFSWVHRKSGRAPKKQTSARRPPMDTRGGITLPSTKPVPEISTASHPLDPEHKYLSHSFVESPDMMNI